MKKFIELFKGRTILEIKDNLNDTWSRIEKGNWKNQKELTLHINKLKVQSTNCLYFKLYSWEKSNIPKEYKYKIMGYYERYSSKEKITQKIHELYKLVGCIHSILYEEIEYEKRKVFC